MGKQEEEAKTAIAGLDFEQLLALFKAAGGNDEATMKMRAKHDAEAREAAEKRENVEHPHISVYSFPEGDIAKPKEKLKCQMFWVGYDVTEDQLTPDEIRLLNLATPGEFQFSRTDGSQERLEITGTNGRAGKMEKLEFLFACRGDNKHNLPSMSATLRQVFGQPTSEDALLAELAKLRSQLASA